jgi:glycosyltransferase involved in cell wall biosynthesis
MNIGIYNRYWSTFGGGEKHIGMIAEVLAMDHNVELLSIERINWEELGKRLSLDLSKCSKRILQNKTCNDLSSYSKEYDVFINSTYNSFLESQAKNSIYMCFFPAELRPSYKEYLKYLIEIFRKLADILLNKVYIFLYRDQIYFKEGGIYNVEEDGRLWFGPDAIFSFNKIKYLDRIALKIWPDSYNEIQKVLVNGEEEDWKIDKSGYLIFNAKGPERRVTVRILSKKYEIKKEEEKSDGRDFGFCIDGRFAIFKSSVLKFPVFGDINRGKALNSYGTIIANSKFTSEWIEKRWFRKSILLEPSIDTNIFNYHPSIKKEKIILSVGRFFSGSHNKKHIEIIEAFIRMIKSGAIDDTWRLELVGGRHLEHKDHIDYFQTLCKLAEGYPIDIRPDLTFNELLKSYQRSQIYIHGAGWGENQNKNPERFEHFGITTCEAMACQCVPVVFDAAGQREIVINSSVGFRFRSYKQLEVHMKNLTNMESAELLKIGLNARNSLNRYSKDALSSRIKNTLKGICY